jgi:hypothetical protein
MRVPRLPDSACRLLIGLVPVFLAAGAMAQSGLPWVGAIERATPAEVSLCVVPDGSGDPLSNAQLFGGQTVDATVTVRLVDGIGAPIANFPFQDLWLTGESATEFACAGPGFLADANTNADGLTVFAQAPYGGGWSEGPIWVYLIGDRGQDPITGEHPPLAMRWNSPDLNADGVVNMIDLVEFAGDYFGPYAYRSDFVWDGTINLTDVVRFVEALGAGCP